MVGAGLKPAPTRRACYKGANPDKIPVLERLARILKLCPINFCEGAMKRNKRTVTMGHEDLTPLTEYILAQMGDEGVDIRERLKNLYRRRSLKNPQSFQEHLDKPA
jgi:hypothetical protein